MIESASFRNFKSLRHVDVNLERLTVLVGPNGSGKTSILEGLQLLSKVASADPDELLKGTLDPVFLFSRGGAIGDMELTCGNGDSTIRLTVKRPVVFPDDLLHPKPSVSLLDGWVSRFECRRNSEPDGGWKSRSDDPSAVECFRFSVLLRADAASLARPSYSDHPNPRVENDGSGMASVLALLALNQPDDFRSLQEHFKSVIPSIRRIRFDRVPVIRTETEVVTFGDDRLTRRLNREYMGDELVFDFEGAADVPAHLASEGTILVLGILASVLGPFRPGLIMIDDLEHGLHPKGQRQIVRVLRNILDEDPGVQIIATTHSPYIVNELDPKEVRVVWAAQNGVTRCVRLDSHPEFERWKDEMWPGEFWSVVGEEWVANGREREGH
jgi:predicted ATPase